MKFINANEYRKTATSKQLVMGDLWGIAIL